MASFVIKPHKEAHKGRGVNQNLVPALKFYLVSCQKECTGVDHEK